MNQYCYFRTPSDTAAELCAPLRELAVTLGHLTNTSTELFRRMDDSKPYVTWMFVLSGVPTEQLQRTPGQIRSALAQAGLARLLMSPVQVESFEPVADGEPK